MPTIYAHDPFLWVQHLLTSRWLDVPMAVVTVACEGWAIALIGLVLLVAIERRGAPVLRAAGSLALTLALTGIAVAVLKREVNTPRPLAVLGPAVHVVLHPLRAHAFPSGHSAAVAALATFAVIRWRARAWPLALLALVGGVSRVYVGAHWALDVVAGWGVGICAALVADAAVRAAAVRVRARQPAPEVAEVE